MFVDKKTETGKQLQQVAAFQQGDREAGEELLRQYEPLLRKLSAKAMDGMDREDVYQELCVTFFEVLRAFDPQKGTSLPGTIRQYLRWKRLNLHRRWTGVSAAEITDVQEYLEPRGGETDGAVTREAFQQLLADIPFPPRQRQVVHLLCEGKTDGDIRRALSLSPQAYSNIRRRIRDTCRRNESFMDTVSEWREVPEGYVDRSLYAFSPSWGEEKAETLNARWD